MGMKSFLIKKALQAKGVSSEQAEIIAKKIDEDPTLAEKLKNLQSNKVVTELFEKIQKEIEEKKKGGMPEQYAMMAVMTKYKEDIQKHRDELAPLMELMMGLKG
jgi:cell fate (sporulation/competence/biofilm development) regulator YlbF (YheA/YmcA/DUF963 family)